MRVISYGGGVQSTALIVLAVQGRIGHVDAAVMANVGDDSEHPKTLRYVREVITPWAAERDFDVIEVQRRRRDGSVETLMGRLTKEGSRSLPIPVRMADTGAPGTRSCTVDFKIRDGHVTTTCATSTRTQPLASTSRPNRSSGSGPCAAARLLARPR